MGRGWKHSRWRGPCGGLLLCFALLVVQGHPFAANAAEKSDGFRFVQISDTHLGQPGSLDRLERIVELINRLPFPIACVVHTGDVFDTAPPDPEVRAQGLRLFKRLDPPLYAVPGNHDIRWRNSSGIGRAWTEPFSGLVHARQVEGVLLVFAATHPLRQSADMSGFRTMARVRSVLQRSGKRPAIVLHHAPCVPQLAKGGLRGGWSDRDRREWIRLVNQSNVIGVLAGHFHRAELHWLGEVPLFVAPSVAGPDISSPVRIYRVHGGKLSYRTVRVRDPRAAAD